MTGRVARVVAFAIAAVALLDPAVPVQRRKPLAIEFIAADTDAARALQRQLLQELAADAVVAGPGSGEAVVAIDHDVDPELIRDGVPVSFVTFRTLPNVRLVRGTTVSQPFAGERSTIAVDADVDGAAGTRSKVAVLQGGVEIGAVEHTWTDTPAQQVSVPFVALAAGSHLVRVVSEPVADERRRDDNALDLNVTTVDRPFRVAFLERRPSWTARFVRRAIETDPGFHVASLTRVSPRVHVRSGNAPRLTSTALEGLEVLAIAAPEDLTAAEVQHVRTFMSERGGTVLLLPDRRPSGPIAALIPASGFDEVLHSSPVVIEAAGQGRGLRASEFAVPRHPARSLQALATLPDGKIVIGAWPIGAGTLIVSGALDAWRYRGSDSDRFATFWRAAIAGAARMAPPAVSVELHPNAARPGTPVRVLARVRRTAFERAPGVLRMPSIRAEALSDAGDRRSPEFIRLWPASEPGLFHGEFVPAEARRYNVLVRAGGAEGAAMLLPGDATARGVDLAEATLVSAATGGVIASADRLAPLVDRLRSHERRSIAATMYPMRSAWWMFPFTIGLCIEWTLRRRRGDR
jgi:hypothetical protein